MDQYLARGRHAFRTYPPPFCDIRHDLCCDARGGQRHQIRRPPSRHDDGRPCPHQRRPRRNAQFYLCRTCGRRCVAMGKLATPRGPHEHVRGRQDIRQLQLQLVVFTFLEIRRKHLRCFGCADWEIRNNVFKELLLTLLIYLTKL